MVTVGEKFVFAFASGGQSYLIDKATGKILSTFNKLSEALLPMTTSSFPPALSSFRGSSIRKGTIGRSMHRTS